MVTGPFRKGYDPRRELSPGRPKGSKHRLSESFISALCDDFDKHGVKAIQKVRDNAPGEYLRVIAQILPKDINVKYDEIEAMEHDEIKRELEAIRDALATGADAGRDEGAFGETVEARAGTARTRTGKGSGLVRPN